jgi:hypothetical protein
MAARRGLFKVSNKRTSRPAAVAAGQPPPPMRESMAVVGQRGRLGPPPHPPPLHCAGSIASRTSSRPPRSVLGRRSQPRRGAASFGGGGGGGAEVVVGGRVRASQANMVQTYVLLGDSSDANMALQRGVVSAWFGRRDTWWAMRRPAVIRHRPNRLRALGRRPHGEEQSIAAQRTVYRNTGLPVLTSGR